LDSVSVSVSVLSFKFDFGFGFGFLHYVVFIASFSILMRKVTLLQKFNSAGIVRASGAPGADIAPLTALGVPGNMSFSCLGFFLLVYVLLSFLFLVCLCCFCYYFILNQLVQSLIVLGAGLSVVDGGQKYFWYHHTNADTIDKMNPTDMNLGRLLRY
jgi:hypothetical protein